MVKHELLVPAGDMESLKQAIFNGADAVYLGCKNFGARKFAKNFDNDEIIEALSLAHLYGVKIYVTMNTLVKADEIESFLNQIEFLHKIGVDAVLIQDFGMINLVRQMYPNLEVHASTQANTSSKQTAKLFYDLGVKRVVFSREMTLEEINEIDVPIEKEVFIHGALCISYSGCCLMSSMLGTRSGNRGECAGSCRLPYTLEIDKRTISKNNYLLSTKELNTSKYFDKLLESNITSFKIEGRMKSPEYVGFITRYYRNLIDKKNINLEKETEKLKTIFNREFTVGNLFSASPKELMNIKTPNHIGLEIGKVIDITPKKIKIKLSKKLNQQDGIRFLNSNKGLIVNYLYDEQGKLTNSASNICYIDNKVGLEKEDIVCKTIDYELMTQLKELPLRKIPVEIEIIAKVGENLKICINDGTTKIETIGSNVQKSINVPLTKERIQKQLEKLGQTPFVCKNINIICEENIFISIKELNELRRELVEKLIIARTTNKNKFLKKNVSFSPSTNINENGLTATVYTEEQLNVCLELNFKRIYVIDKNLYEKYATHKNVYYYLPRCLRNPYCEITERILQSDYFTNSTEFIANYPLNVTNIYTVYYLHKLNAKAINLSVELTENEIINLINSYQQKFATTPQIELLVYGYVENMLIKGNILALEENKHNAILRDIKNREFKVYYDGVNTHILNFEKKCITSTTILNKINNARFDFYDESATEIKNIVKNYY